MGIYNFLKALNKIISFNFEIGRRVPGLFQKF